MSAPVKIILLVALPVGLYFIPIDKLNGQHTVCLFKNLTGHECWGCGITRAVVSAVQFHFAAAFQYNKLIVIVFPLLVYQWGKMFVKNWIQIKASNFNK
jgi:hypothetical protein